MCACRRERLADVRGCGCELTTGHPVGKLLPEVEASFQQQMESLDRLARARRAQGLSVWARASGGPVSYGSSAAQRPWWQTDGWTPPVQHPHL